MKVAIIGSRSLTNVNISKYIPKEVTEIITGGTVGIYILFLLIVVICSSDLIFPAK